MAFILNNFQTRQGLILSQGYYKLGNISWDLSTNQVNCVLYLYASQEAEQQKKAFFPLETINYSFILNNQNSNLPNACYSSIVSLIQNYKAIEAAIMQYENDDNNYEVTYDEETGEEIARELIPNDELYSQRIILPFGLEKLLDATQIDD